MTAARQDATDEMLMVRYQRGDARAFAEIVERHSRFVYNFVLRTVRDPAAAEALSLEVFFRVVQDAAKFKHEASFCTWLYGIVQDVCTSFGRHPSGRAPDSVRARPPERPERPHAGAPQADGPTSERPQGAPASSDVGRRTLEAIDALPDDLREVYLLRELSRLPFREIAELTGAAESTVKGRMRYALDRLQQALAGFEEYARALR